MIFGPHFCFIVRNSAVLCPGILFQVPFPSTNCDCPGVVPRPLVIIQNIPPSTLPLTIGGILLCPFFIRTSCSGLCRYFPQGPAPKYGVENGRFCSHPPAPGINTTKLTFPFLYSAGVQKLFTTTKMIREANAVIDTFAFLCFRMLFLSTIR